jgi:hypothetical protein
MVGKIFYAACVLLLLLSVSFADRANVSVQVPVTDVTVYSNGYAFVKRGGTLSLIGGEVSLLIENFTESAIIDSVSVHDNMGGVREIAQYELKNSKNKSIYVPFDEILNQSVGTAVSALTKNGWENGTLSWFSSDRLGIEAGGKLTILRFEDVEELEAPVAKYKKDVEVNETERGLRIDELSTAGSHNMVMSYIVPKVGWSADYNYYISSDTDTGSGALQAWASVSNNAGEDWKNATLKVVVGYPHMLSYISQVVRKAAESAYAPTPANTGGSTLPSFVSSLFSEYYVYTLTYPVTLRDGETRSLALFDNTVNFRKEYIWDTAWERPHKVYAINNSLDQSWAPGTARIYLAGDFLGEDSIQYTAKGKEAEVTVAEVPDVIVKKHVNSTTAEEYRNSRTTTYKVSLEIENRRDEETALTVRDWMNSGDVVTLTASNPLGERNEQNKLEWKIMLEKGESKTISYEYTVTNYYYY